MLTKYIFFLLALLSVIIALLNKKETGLLSNSVKAVIEQTEGQQMQVQSKECPSDHTYDLSNWDDLFQSPDDFQLMDNLQHWIIACKTYIQSVSYLYYKKDNNIYLPNIKALKLILPYFLELESFYLNLKRVSLKDIDGIQFLKFKQQTQCALNIFLDSNGIQDLTPLKQIKYNNNQTFFTFQYSFQQNKINNLSNLFSDQYLKPTQFNLFFGENQIQQIDNIFNNTIIESGHIQINISYNQIKEIQFKSYMQIFKSNYELSLYFQYNKLENFSFCDKCLGYPLQHLDLDLSNNIYYSNIDQIFEDLKSFLSISYLNQTFNNNSITQIGRAFDQYFHDAPNLETAILYLRQNQLPQEEQTFCKRVFYDLVQKGVIAFIYF